MDLYEEYSNYSPGVKNCHRSHLSDRLMKRLNQTESPIFVILCVLVPKAIPFDFYFTDMEKKKL